MIYTYSSQVIMIYTVATTITKALYYSICYVSMIYIYNSYVTMIYTVATTITKALHYSNYYVSMIYTHSSYVTMIYRTLLHSKILRYYTPNVTTI